MSLLLLDYLNNEIQHRTANQGDLSTLTTAAKNSLVAAINEVNTLSGNIGSTSLQVSANLSDLADVATARANLNVYASGEVDNAILEAQLNMGSNYNAADIPARDALTDLDLGDRVFVEDAGDGKWALFKPTTVDANGTGTAWLKLSDQDSLENAVSATSIKASYESNADTNAFTDAAKAKVDFLGVTSAVDLDKLSLVSVTEAVSLDKLNLLTVTGVVNLDKVGLISVTGAVDLDDGVYKAGLEQDLGAAAPTDNAASAGATKSYVDASRPVAFLETVTVAADQVTLTHEPLDGLAGILNFATVRFDDGTGPVDASLTATADPKVFDIAVDTPGQWDGQGVKVQYHYTVA